MPFKSGESAEKAARALAERLNRAGAAAELQIRLRDGAIAARYAFAPIDNGASPKP
ncbi:hypothetical protein [Caulobacter segnis]